MSVFSARNAFFSAALSGLLSACGVTTQQEVSRNLGPDTLDLTTMITPQSASRLRNELRRASAEMPGTPAVMTINSPGGDVIPGFRIIDQIQNMETPPVMNCTGDAASMAAIIFVTATGQNRNAESDCRIMIHQSYYTVMATDGLTPVASNYDSIKSAFEFSQAETDIMNFTITQPGNPPYVISRRTLEDWHEKLTDRRDSFATMISANSRFTQADVYSLLDQGDVYFDAPAAAWAGLIDTIDGKKPSAAVLADGGQRFCDNIENISICPN